MPAGGHRLLGNKLWFTGGAKNLTAGQRSVSDALADGKKGETRSNAVPVEARHQSATTKGTSVNAAPPCPLTIEIMIPGPSGHPGLHGTVDWRFCVQNTRITSLVNLFGHIRKNIHWKNAGKCGSDEG